MKRQNIANPEDFIPRNSYNPYRVRGFLFYNEYGLIGLAYGDCMQSALEAMIDRHMLDCMLITDSDDINEDTAYLGNAGEPFDISYLRVIESDNRKNA